MMKNFCFYILLLFCGLALSSCSDDDEDCGCTTAMRYEVLACDNPWDDDERIDQQESLEERMKRFLELRHIQITAFEVNNEGLVEACPQCCRNGKRIIISVPNVDVPFLESKGFIALEE